MASFTLIINASPPSQSASTALHFAEAVCAEGHRIRRLFFFQDGVYNASVFAVLPQDQHDLPAAWQALIEREQLDAVVCVASALSRGILDDSEAERYEKHAANLSPGFEISGIGQLIEACVDSDRVVNFLP